MRRATRVVVKIAAAGACVGLVAVGPGTETPAAATPVSGLVVAVGWWSSRPTATAQPGGGFEVASGPDGSAQSVAAMEVRVDIATMSKLQLTLTESTSVGNQLAHLRICPAAPGWSPANPGAFGDAPSIDCSGKVVDLAHADNGTWVGNIAPLLPNGGTASLGVVPISDSPAPVGSGLLVDISGVDISGDGQLIDRTVTPPPPSDSSPPPAVNYGGYTDTPIINLDPGTVANPGNGFELPSSSASASAARPATDLTSTLTKRPGPSRPWMRLVWLTPLAAAIGVGLVYGRRFLVGRGVTFS